MKHNFSTLSFQLVLLLAACHTPQVQHESDADFKNILAKGKRYVESYPDSALMILHPLLQQQQGDDKIDRCGYVLNQIGSTYDTKGMYDSAAYYLYEALRLAEEAKDDTLKLSVLTNLGIVQFEMQNADEAVNYHRQSLAIAEKLKDSINMAKSLNNIGNTYMTLNNDFTKAIPPLEQCVEISQKINFTSGIKVAGINLAMMYNEQGEPNRAMQQINYLTTNYGSNIYADFLRGEIYLKKENYARAIHEWKELLKKRLNTREFEHVILQKIGTTYKIIGNLDSTVTYLEKTYALRDSLHNQQNYKTINELKITYETEKKEARIATLEGEKRLMMWLFIAGGTVLFLMLATFILLWRWIVQKKRFAENRKELAEQKIKQLEQEKQLIATQSVLDGEVKERTRLARDLHDGLGSMLTGLKMKLINLKNRAGNADYDTTNFDNALSILDESMSEMRRVAHHLMPDSLSRFGLKAAIGDFCDTLPAVRFAWYGNSERLNSKLETVVYRITHELINNALKHSGASQIIVQIVQDADRIAITVQDNGCGFDTTTVSKGMGLQNIRTRVTSFGGIINIYSNAGEGTEINVEIRINE
ncbi:MAG: sensor histidine kinase [Cytophagaceae bacterium]|jgi:signal transduction histidine kinase/predicted negative regulator of RcsB-dependent stress response|nr:sensor histidine kinase [Cytophagaceae bacterium]